MHAAAITSRPGCDRPPTTADDVNVASQAAWLLCRVGTQLWALPIEHVIEIMRSLPVAPIASAPPYVRGLSIIRGAPVPVIDAALLAGHQAAEAARLVTIRVGTRTIALAVQSVLGITRLASDMAGQLPPLLREAANEMVEAIGIRDAELIFFLRAARIVPEDVLAAIGEARAAS